jgi:hypothetical protein
VLADTDQSSAYQVNHNDSFRAGFSERAMKRILSIAILGYFLSSCIPILSADIEITLSADEKWRAKTEVVFTQQQLGLLAGNIDNGFEEIVQEIRRSGVDAQWNRNEDRDDGNIGYVITANGQGLENLNDAFFDGNKAFTLDQSDGKRRIVFSHYPGNSSLGMVQNETFTLKGGRIISTNGRQIDRRTVTWTNPNGLIFVVSATMLGVRRMSRKRSSSPTTHATDLTEIPAGFCTNCGSALPSAAVFCPKCGYQR